MPEQEKYDQDSGERRCIGKQLGKLENDVDYVWNYQSSQ